MLQESVRFTPSEDKAVDTNIATDTNIKQPKFRDNSQSLFIDPQQVSMQRMTSFNVGDAFEPYGGYKRIDRRAVTSLSDLEDIPEERAQTQSGWSKMGLFVPRTLAKAATEAVRFPGTIGGIVEWATTGFDMEQFEASMDNAWMRGLDNIQQTVNEDVFPVYVRREIEEGNLLKKLTSADWWATTGADGSGFMVGMLGPGLAVRALRIGTKVAQGVHKGLKLSAKTATKFGQHADDVIATAINTVNEAALEGYFVAKELSEEFYNNKLEELLKTGQYDPQEAADLAAAYIDTPEVREKIGKAGANVTSANMAILLLPNYVDQMWLFSKAGKGGSRVAKEIGKKFATGEAPTVMTKKALIKEGASKVVVGGVKEGFWEEGLQNASGDYFKDRAMGLNDKSLIPGILSTYIEGLSDVQMQEEIFLGAFLGGIMGGAGSVRSRINEDKILHGDGNKSKGLIELIDNNLINRYRSVEDMIKVDEDGKKQFIDGKPVFDPAKATRWMEDLIKSETNKELLKVYQELGSEAAFSFAKYVHDFNEMMPYFQVDGGKELLAQRIEHLAQKDSEYLKETLGIDSKTTQEIKADLLKKADVFEEIFYKNKLNHKAPNIDTSIGTKEQAAEFSNRIEDLKLSTLVQQEYLIEQITETEKTINNLEAKETLRNDQQEELEVLKSKQEAFKGTLDVLRQKYKAASNTKDIQDLWKEFIEFDKARTEEVTKDAAENADNPEVLRKEADKTDNPSAKKGTKAGINKRAKEEGNARFTKPSKEEVEVINQAAQKVKNNKPITPEEDIIKNKFPEEYAEALGQAVPTTKNSEAYLDKLATFSKDKAELVSWVEKALQGKVDDGTLISISEAIEDANTPEELDALFDKFKGITGFKEAVDQFQDKKNEDAVETVTPEVEALLKHNEALHKKNAILTDIPAAETVEPVVEQAPTTPTTASVANSIIEFNKFTDKGFEEANAFIQELKDAGLDEQARAALRPGDNLTTLYDPNEVVWVSDDVLKKNKELFDGIEGEVYEGGKRFRNDLIPDIYKRVWLTHNDVKVGVVFDKNNTKVTNDIKARTVAGNDINLTIEQHWFNENFDKLEAATENVSDIFANDKGNNLRIAYVGGNEFQTWLAPENDFTGILPSKGAKLGQVGFVIPKYSNNKYSFYPLITKTLETNTEDLIKAIDLLKDVEDYSEFQEAHPKVDELNDLIPLSVLRTTNKKGPAKGQEVYSFIVDSISMPTKESKEAGQLTIGEKLLTATNPDNAKQSAITILELEKGKFNVIIPAWAIDNLRIKSEVEPFFSELVKQPRNADNNLQLLNSAIVDWLGQMQYTISSETIAEANNRNQSAIDLISSRTVTNLSNSPLKNPNFSFVEPNTKVESPTNTKANPSKTGTVEDIDVESMASKNTAAAEALFGHKENTKKVVERQTKEETPEQKQQQKADIEKNEIESTIVDRGKFKGKTRRVFEEKSIEEVEGDKIVVTKYSAKVGDRDVSLGGRTMTLKEFREEFPITDEMNTDDENYFDAWEDDDKITIFKIEEAPDGSRFDSVAKIKIGADKITIPIKKNNAKYDAEIDALEQTPEIKPDDSIDTDVAENPFDFKLREAKLGEIYTKWNEDEETAWLKKNLPDIETNTYKGLKSKLEGVNVLAYGVFKDSVIHLSRVAKVGTAYHEAYHAVHWLGLSPRERAVVERAAGKKYGLTDQVLIEEALAEDFVNYKLDQDGRNLPKKVLDWFKRLLGWIQSNIFNTPTIDYIYYKLNNGKFASINPDSNLKITRVSSAFSGVELHKNVDILVNGISHVIDSYLNNPANAALKGYTRSQLLTSVKAPDNHANYADYFFNLTKQFLIKTYNANKDTAPAEWVTSMKSLINESVNKDSEGNIVYGAVGVLAKQKLASIEGIREVSKRIVETDGIEFEFDNLNEETVKGTQWSSTSKEMSGQIGLSAATRRELSRIPVDNVQRDHLGLLPLTMPVDSAYAYLKAGLADIPTKAAMIEKLKLISDKLPMFKGYYDRVLANDVLASNMFIDFWKTTANFTKVYQTRRGDIRIINSIDSTAADSVILNWESKFYDNGLIDKEGKLTSKIIPIVSELKGLTELELIEGFNNAFNLELNPAALQEIDSKDVSYLLGDLAKFNPKSGKWSLGVNVFEKNKNRLRSIAKVEAPYRIDLVESSFRNAEGKTVYGHILPGFAAKFVARLKNNPKQILDFYKDDPFYANSPLFRRFRNVPGAIESFEYALADGINYKGMNEGTIYTDFSDRDYLAYSLAMYHNNNTKGFAYYSAPILSDSSEGMFFKLPKTSREAAIDNIVEVVKQEYSRIKEELDTPDFKFYKENKTKLHFIPLQVSKIANKSGIFPDNIIKEKVTEYLDKRFEAYWDELQRNKIFDTNDPVIDRAFVGIYFKKGAELSDAQIEKIRNVIKTQYVNSVFAATQIVTFTTGDPAFYKNVTDFYKRSKEIISPTLQMDTEATYKVVGKDSSIATANAPTKEGVNFVFGTNPELASIGTQEQYSQYLDTVFPDSRVKEIYQHSSNIDLQKEGFKKGFGKTSDAFFFDKFGTDEYSGKYNVKVLLDVKNIFSRYTTINEFINAKYGKDSIKNIQEEIGLENRGYIVKYKNKEAFDEYMSYMAEENPDSESSQFIKRGRIGELQKYGNFDAIDAQGYLAVFEPEQIHILGSKQDIEGFKNFVKNSTKDFNQIITPGRTYNSLYVNDHEVVGQIANDFWKDYEDTGNIESAKLAAQYGYSNHTVTDKDGKKSDFVKVGGKESYAVELPTPSDTINIYAGDNQNAELSNFAIRPFKYNYETGTEKGAVEIQFKSVEQGFHFYKAMVSNNREIASKILKTTNGAELKRLTNRANLPMNSEQVKEWDSQAKSVMLNLMYESYIQNPKEAQKLVNTGDAVITHTQDNTRWKTDFPEVVMTVREMLVEEGISSNSTTQLFKTQLVNTADAQTFIHPNRYRKVMVGYQRWNKQLQNTWNKLVNNEVLTPEDYDVSFNALKPFMFSHLKHDSGKVVPTQNKNSEFMLSPHLAAKSPTLKAMYDLMEKQNIDSISFTSVVKVGEYNTVSLEDILNDNVPDDYIHTLNNEDYGLQQETPEHHIDTDSLFGSQIRKLIIAGINFEGIYTVDGIEMTGQQVYDEYHRLISENIRDSYDGVLDEIGDFTDGKFSISFPKLSDLLTGEVLKQQLGQDVLEAVSLNSDGKLNIHPSDPLMLDTVEKLLNAVFKNRVTKQKIKGGSLIQTSGIGFSSDLKVVTAKDSDGNMHIVEYEVMLPWSSKKHFEPFMDSKGHIDITKVPESLLKMIGYRIPTEDKYSMVPMKVVGFTDYQLGGVIMLPIEITTIAGSDFDVDKLYVMMHEFNIRVRDKYNFIREAKKAKVDSDLSQSNVETVLDMIEAGMPLEGNDLNIYDFLKEEYEPNNPPTIHKNNNLETTKGRNNRLIDLMYGILTNAHTFKDAITPGGIGKFQTPANLIYLARKGQDYHALKAQLGEGTLSEEDLKDMVDRMMESDEQIGFADPYSNLKVFRRNMAGKALVGIMANHNVARALLQHTNIGLDRPIMFAGNTYQELNRKTDRLGNPISFGSDVATATDNAKDPNAYKVNINTYTADTYSLLQHLGATKEEAFAFISQPVIVELAEKYFREGGTYTAERKVIDDIFKRYNRTLPNLKEVTETNIPFNDLLKQLSNPTKNTQLDALINFLIYKDKATSLGVFIGATKPDTSGRAPTMAGNEIAIRNIRETLKDENLTGVKELFDGEVYPMFREFIQNGLIKPNELMQNIFPLSNTNHSSVIDRTKVRLQDAIAKSKLNEKDLQKFNSVVLTYLSEKINAFKAVDEKGRNLQQLFMKFPAKFRDVVTPELRTKYQILKHIEYVNNDRLEFARLEFKNTGSLTKMMKDELKASWNNMRKDLNKEVRELAENLIRYVKYKEGFIFGPKTFAHLIPVEFSLNVREGDNKSIRDTWYDILESDNMSLTPSDIQNIVDMFISNNWKNTGFVAKVTQEDLGKNGTITFDNNIPRVVTVNANSNLKKGDTFVRFIKVPFEVEIPSENITKPNEIRTEYVLMKGDIKYDENGFAFASVYVPTAKKGAGGMLFETTIGQSILQENNKYVTPIDNKKANKDISKVTRDVETTETVSKPQQKEVSLSERKDMTNISTFTNYSGAALGGDTVWATIGKEFGLGKQVNYRPEDLQKLTKEQLLEVENAYQQAVKDLGRKPLAANTFAGGLVRRDYLQAKAADAVFAVSTIVEPGQKDPKGYVNKTNKSIVSGGTGYAVQMAINLGKPVYVFDQNKEEWYSYETGLQDPITGATFNDFIKWDTPTLTTKFAGIGTREINDAGKQAIREVYEKTTQQSETITQEQLEIINFNMEFESQGWNGITMEQFNALSKEEQNKIKECYG